MNWTKREVFFLPRYDYEQDFWVYKEGDDNWMIMCISSDGAEVWEEEFSTSDEAKSHLESEMDKWDRDNDQ